MPARHTTNISDGLNHWGHISNECSSCLVEAGYWTAPSGGNTESYFWGDETPNSSILDHFLSDVPQQDYNIPVNLTIIRNSLNSCDWYIDIVGATDSFYPQSTNNCMNPTGTHSAVQIGMELAGHNSDYASAPDAWFTNNQWASSSGWNYQTNTGVGTEPQSHDPPYMLDPTKPAPGNQGGRLYTYCCPMTGSTAPINPQVPSTAPTSPTKALGLAAIKPDVRQASGAMFDNTAVTAYVLRSSIPRAIQLSSSIKPTSVQTIVLGTSQEISGLLNGEYMGVPDGTLLYYVQVGGDFAFPTSPGGPVIMSNHAVEVFDATTGNLLIAGS